MCKDICHRQHPHPRARSARLTLRHLPEPGTPHLNLSTPAKTLCTPSSWGANKLHFCTRNKWPLPHPSPRPPWGAPRLRQPPWRGRDDLPVNTSRRGQAAPAGPAPLAPVTRAVKGSGGARDPFPAPARPGPAYRTRLTSPFLQLVNRSLVSMAGPGRGAAAPH